MIELKDKDSGKVIGSITEDQLQFLIDQLEEETEEDVDYYINRETLGLFQERGIDPELSKILKEAMGNREEMEIEWEKK